MPGDFKFNFNVSGEEGGSYNKGESYKTNIATDKRQPEEILLKQQHIDVKWFPDPSYSRCQSASMHRQQENVLVVNLNHEPNNDFVVHYLSGSAVETELNTHYDGENVVIQAYNAGSDLVPGKYEGGLKIWECAIDLAEYLVNKVDLSGIKGSKVLELGCGAGLPGIVFLLNGATVHFQDYNREVIERVSIPNVLLNKSKLEKTEPNSQDQNCRFFSGDWSMILSILMDSLGNDRYDYIVTSETIYNPENFATLYEIMKTTLKSKGKIYVAAKTCYFGVGGGTRQFINYVENKGEFNVSICASTDEGVKREILQMMHKNE